MKSSEKWLTGSAETHKLDNIFRRVMVISNLDILADLMAFPNGLDTFFIKPSDWVSGLYFYPFRIRNHDTVDDVRVPVILGKKETSLLGYQINDVISLFNMGEYFVTPKFNNFADYNGYSKMEVWLPYYGLIDVDLNQTVGRYLKFRLNVDFTSGMGVYYVCVGDTPTESDSIFAPYEEDIQILSTHSVQIGLQIPLGTTNAIDVVRNLALGAVKTGLNIAGGYAVAGLGLSSGTSTTTKNITTTRRNPNTGRQVTSRKRTETSQTTYDGSNYQYGRGITEVFNYAGDSLYNMHISASTDRVNNPASLSFGCQSIKIVRYYPKITETNEAYGRLYGYPLGEAVELSTLTGYTVVTEFHIEGDGFGQATRKEIMMIKEALSEGIIL